MSIFLITEMLLQKPDQESSNNETKRIIETVKQEPTEETFESEMICRCCTTPADIPLTENIDSITTITSAIRAVANLSIHDNDSYPQYICANCLEELKLALKFKRKCEASDMIFRKASQTNISSHMPQATSLNKDNFSSIHSQLDLKRYENSKRDNINNNSNDDTFHDDINVNVKSDNSCDEDDKPLMKLREIKDKSITQVKVPPRVHNRHKHKKKFPIKIEKDSKEKSSENFKPKNKKEEALSMKWICKKCDTTFDTKEAWREHNKEKSCAYRPCPMCGKIVQNLPMHEKVVHLRPEKFTCDQCGRNYYSLAALRNHLNTHKDPQEYCCDLCPYKGKRKSYLVCHMRLHTGDFYRYLCSKCPLKFSNPSNLAKHQLIHIGKQFECNKCKKKFRTRKVLKEHYDSIHLNIRYRCTVCGRDLSTRKKLLSHELRIHKREKHKLFENIQTVVVSNEQESLPSSYPLGS